MSSNLKPPVILWFRRNLRLTDNLPLLQAVASGQPVIPLYIISDWKNQHRWTGPVRQEFLCGCLASLAANLESRGSRLIFRKGPTIETLTRVIRESGATAVYFAHDTDPEGRQIEKKLENVAMDMGFSLHGSLDHLLAHPDSVKTQGGTPFRVYTPFYRQWNSLPKVAADFQAVNPGPTPNLPSDPPPTLATWNLPPSQADGPAPGERAARDRMKLALKEIVPDYQHNRDIPAGHTTSRLSQDLRFGLISPRELFQKSRDLGQFNPKAASGSEIYIKELAWREFYMSVLWHWPEVLEQEFNKDFRLLEWEYDEEGFAQWQQGLTGFPIVDAGMRQLGSTGFMHNRLRMITAMFLTKDLGIDWRRGEQFFMKKLVDGEIASNNGGWQWSAGTGADAAPYFRIQNPWSQSQRHDPQGIFIKRWIPELANVPAEKLHQPPADGKGLAPGYPPPILNHAEARNKTLVRFARAKDRYRGSTM